MNLIGGVGDKIILAFAHNDTPDSTKGWILAEHIEDKIIPVFDVGE